MPTWSMARFIEPVTLTGTHATLEPLSIEHAEGLRRAVRDGELWRIWVTQIPTPEGIGAYIDSALKMRDEQEAMPFAVRRLSDGLIVGTTRYFNVVPEHRRLEIGHTWYSESAQRTAINTECKLLLLRHAFEELGSIAVELRTSSFNFRSRQAIQRLGAKQDAILRNHMILADGTYRDTVVFSIIESEWPAVKRNLQYLLSG